MEWEQIKIGKYKDTETVEKKTYYTHSQHKKKKEKKQEREREEENK